MPKNDALQLQNRDLTLLRGLFECRVMTTDHATAMYFNGNYDPAKKRLQKIKAAGLITERPRRAFDPSETPRPAPSHRKYPCGCLRFSTVCVSAANAMQTHLKIE